MALDWDGTLYDSFSAVYLGWNAILNELGRKRFTSHKAFREWHEASPKETFAKLDIKMGSEEHAKALEIYYEAIRNKKVHPKLFRGVIPAVKKLAKKYDLAIVSSAREDYIRNNLSCLEEDIKIIVDQNACSNIKPYPDPFQYLAKKLNVSPKQIISVGDTTADIISAREAGVEKIIAVTYGKFEDKEKLDALDPDQLLDSTKQLRYI